MHGEGVEGGRGESEGCLAQWWISVVDRMVVRTVEMSDESSFFDNRLCLFVMFVLMSIRVPKDPAVPFGFKFCWMTLGFKHCIPGSEVRLSLFVRRKKIVKCRDIQLQRAVGG